MTTRPSESSSRRATPRTFAASLRDGDSPDVVRVGDARAPIGDLYHALVSMRWSTFIALFVIGFFLLNCFFAVLFALDANGLNITASEKIPVFLIAFFFSVHTIATVGYGNVYPQDLFANVVVVIEIAVGLLYFALTSGLVFARFSRPTARVLFSNVAVVREFGGGPMLLLRAANQRHNFIFEANVRCSLLRLETISGREIRRFYDLKLERAATPVFSLSWTIMHRIDAESPLFGLDQEAFEAGGDEIIVSLTGLDSSVSQLIHARAAYGPGDVLFGREFVDVLSRDESGRLIIDYRRFHEVRPIDAGAT